MSIYKERVPFAFYLILFVVTLFLILFLKILYITILLDFCNTQEMSAKITDRTITMTRSGARYDIYYRFKPKEKNIIVLGHNNSLDFREFEDSKLSPNIQIVYLVSDPDINSPIIKIKNIWDYLTFIPVILILLRIIVWLLGVIGFNSKKEKINPNKVINSMRPYD
jgi:hypothetical protein